MGLIITAYRRLTPARSPLADDVVTFYPNDASFEGREKPVEYGVPYEYASRFIVDMGTYSEYGEWREWLAEVAGWQPHPSTRRPECARSEACWAHRPLKGESSPFWSLINFTDCDGVIGSDACRLIYADFATHASRAHAIDPARAYELEKYEELWKAFEMACDGGAVKFH